MRILIIIITTYLFCASCGIKEEPKYQVQNNYDKKVNTI